MARKRIKGSVGVCRAPAGSWSGSRPTRLASLPKLDSNLSVLSLYCIARVLAKTRPGSSSVSRTKLWLVRSWGNACFCQAEEVGAHASPRNALTAQAG